MSPTNNYDALVVGAGFTGLYTVYKLRELGLKVCGVEAGNGVGGTWYWNRYPGARTDSQSYVYQYFFSKEILSEWNWSERFPSQQETEQYLNFVADKLDLKSHYKFGQQVTEARYAEEDQTWNIITAEGMRLSASFLVMGSGGLTVPKNPEVHGIKDFDGEVIHTSRWPQEGLVIKDKRVGVIGTGATGIQVIQSIGKNVERLTVFQRTANYTIPMRNPKYDDKKRTELRKKYPDIKKQRNETFAGFSFDFQEVPFKDLEPPARKKMMEKYWADGSLSFWIGQFPEIFFEEEANREVSNFVKQKIRARINDPELANKLIPNDHGFGTRRVPLENQYYEIFNQQNVMLVDVNEEPLQSIEKNGIRTSKTFYELDSLIFATGFDAGTGALTSIDLYGKDNRLLRDEWNDKGISTFMGLQVHGYPNMFMVMAPMSPVAAFCNVPTCVEQSVDWISDCIKHVREKGAKSVEPSLQAEQEWVKHHDEVADETLVSKVDSWYTSANVPGKMRRVIPYCGGANVYREHCDKVRKGGFSECIIS